MSDPVFIGIDNGLNGAISIICDNKVRNCEPLPIIKGKRSTYDIKEILAMIAHIKSCYDIKMVVLEEAVVIPIGGSLSHFTTGRCYGQMESILTALGVPFTCIKPQIWQKALFGKRPKGTTKQDSLTYCQRMFPNQSFLATQRSRKPHDGMTDATCLAVYAKRMFG